LVPGALKAVIFISLAGTFILGVWPQPFMNFAVAATDIFSHLGPTPVVSTLP
jgi:NADH-quinone oxidoreductase subunit N